MEKKFGTFENSDGSQTTRRIIKSLDEAPPSLRATLRQQEKELEGGGCSCTGCLIIFIILFILIKLIF